MSKQNQLHSSGVDRGPVRDLVREEFESDYAEEDPFHHAVSKQQDPAADPFEALTLQSADAVPHTMEAGLMLLAIYRASQDGSILGVTTKDGKVFSARVISSGLELNEVDFAVDEDFDSSTESFRGSDWSEGEAEFGFIDAETGAPLGFSLSEIAWVGSEADEAIGDHGDLLRPPAPGTFTPPSRADLAIMNLLDFALSKENCTLRFVNDVFPSGIALRGQVLSYNLKSNAGVFASKDFGRIAFDLDHCEVELLVIPPADALQLKLPIRDTFSPEAVPPMSSDELFDAAQLSGGIAFGARLYVSGINEILQGALALANLRGAIGELRSDGAHRSQFSRLMGALRDDNAKGVWYINPITERSVWIPLERVHRIELAETQEQIAEP